MTTDPQLEPQDETADHVVIESCDEPSKGITAVGVQLGHHRAIAVVRHGLFFERRMRRTLRKLTDRVFMLARRERDWFMTASEVTER